MMALIVVSQFLLYASLSILMGTFLMHCIPTKYRPGFQIAPIWLVLSVIIIPIAAFLPNLQLLSILGPQFGLVDSLWMIVSKYKVGHAWLAIFGFALLLIVIVRAATKKASTWLYVCATFVLMAIMAAIGYASHAGSISGMAGSFLDFIHLLAVSVWLGILVIIGYFSTDTKNWSAFLQWFSPTALAAFTSIAISGVLMMEVIVQKYVTSWASTYGQFLFIKHVLLVPLAIIILANGLLIKLKINQPLFEPRTWVKIELTLLAAILVVTAIFTEQQPPNFTVEAISPFFEIFYQDSVAVGMRAYLQMTGIGLMFFLLTAVFIGLTIVSYLKQVPTIVASALVFAIALCFYMGFMSIVFFK